MTGPQRVERTVELLRRLYRRHLDQQAAAADDRAEVERHGSP